MLASFDAYSIIFWIITAIALLVALTIHEFCHALTADLLGDPNPRLQGRLSLNPLKHLDPLGTISLLLFHFGWGKPVEFDPYNLKNPKKDSALIALAGPVSNFIIALLCSLILRLVLNTQVAALTMAQFSTSMTGVEFIITLLYFLVVINIGLGVFNLLPIPPLDGHHILGAFLPNKTYYAYKQAVRRFGPFLLILFIIPLFGDRSIISYVTTPLIDFFTQLMLPF